MIITKQNDSKQWEGLERGTGNQNEERLKKSLSKLLKMRSFSEHIY